MERSITFKAKYLKENSTSSIASNFTKLTSSIQFMVIKNLIRYLVAKVTILGEKTSTSNMFQLKRNKISKMMTIMLIRKKEIN